MSPSELIDERYRLVRRLGTGGMAEVWLAEDTRLGRFVAMKFLLEGVQGADAGALAMGIEDEARLVAGLQHPNIVAVYDAGVAGGRSYLVMQYVEGQSLRQVLDASGPLPEREAVRCGQQVAAALQYAHLRGVVHCDVKPENILVSPTGDVKVTDFGVAAQVTKTLTPQQAREILGTIAYLAPEVLQGEPSGPASDVYSLGLTLFELVAGRLPFAGATPALVAAQRLAAPAPLLRTIAPHASVELETVLARALALRSADRFPDAGALSQALDAVARFPARPGPHPTVGIAPAPAPVQRRPAPPARITSPPRRGSGVALTVAVAGVLLLIAGISAVALALFASDDDGSSQSPTPTAQGHTLPTALPTAEPTPTATPTAEPTLTPTPSKTPTRTPGVSTTATVTRTPASTATVTPSRSPTSTTTPGPPAPTP